MGLKLDLLWHDNNIGINSLTRMDFWTYEQTDGWKYGWMDKRSLEGYYMTC